MTLLVALALLPLMAPGAATMLAVEGPGPAASQGCYPRPQFAGFPDPRALELSTAELLLPADGRGTILLGRVERIEAASHRREYPDEVAAKLLGPAENWVIHYTRVHLAVLECMAGDMGDRVVLCQPNVIFESGGQPVISDIPHRPWLMPDDTVIVTMRGDEHSAWKCRPIDQAWVLVADGPDSLFFHASEWEWLGENEGTGLGQDPSQELLVRTLIDRTLVPAGDCSLQGFRAAVRARLRELADRRD